MKKLLFVIGLLISIGVKAQIPLAGYITTLGGSYPTHLDTLGMGGFMTFQSITERNAIPTPRRKVGMLVYTRTEDKFWQLKGGVSNGFWIEITIGNSAASWGSITGNINSQTDLINKFNTKQNLITTGSISEYFRGDFSLATLNKAAVGLGNVDNTSDINKPISTATQTALNAKFNTADYVIPNLNQVIDAGSTLSGFKSITASGLTFNTGAVFQINQSLGGTFHVQQGSNNSFISMASGNVLLKGSTLGSSTKSSNITLRGDAIVVNGDSTTFGMFYSADYFSNALPGSFTKDRFIPDFGAVAKTINDSLNTNIRPKIFWQLNGSNNLTYKTFAGSRIDVMGKTFYADSANLIDLRASGGVYAAGVQVKQGVGGFPGMDIYIKDTALRQGTIQLFAGGTRDQREMFVSVGDEHNYTQYIKDGTGFNFTVRTGYNSEFGTTFYRNGNVGIGTRSGNIGAYAYRLTHTLAVSGNGIFLGTLEIPFVSLPDSSNAALSTGAFKRYMVSYTPGGGTGGIGKDSVNSLIKLYLDTAVAKVKVALPLYVTSIDSILRVKYDSAIWYADSTIYATRSYANSLISGGSGTVSSGAANRLAYYGASGTTVSNLSAITASKLLGSDANGLPVALTPSVTEANYLAGVTSAIQTQLNGKLSLTLSGNATINPNGNTLYILNSANDAFITASNTAVQFGSTDHYIQSNLTTFQFIDTRSTKTGIEYANDYSATYSSRTLVDKGYITTAAVTMANKRITQRATTITSSSTPTPDGDASDEFTVTALAANATFAAPTGTPTEGQALLVRIKDNGTARTLSWNAIYRASTDFALPTTTVLSKTMYVQFVYNTADSKWDAVGLTQGF